MYDEHGSEGKISNNATDFSPSKNGDNSIQTNQFKPSGGACVAINIAPTFNVYVGYADTYRSPSGTPSPWQDSSNVTFYGCNPSFLFPGDDQCPQVNGRDYIDGGAIRFDVPSNAPALSVTNVSVQVNGPNNTCTFDPWPSLNATVQPGNTLILAETGTTGISSCSPHGENFDTSEVNQTTCQNDGDIPVITATLNGTVTTFHDTKQVLNTGGFDVGACLSEDETLPWSPISPG
jgi:hypothetical protein